MAEDCWLQARLYLGIEHSPEQQEKESLCFSILVGHGQSHTFRVELATDLAIWEKSFQRAVFLEVQRIRVSISVLQCGKFSKRVCFCCGVLKCSSWIKGGVYRADEPPTTPLPSLKGWYEGFVCWNEEHGSTLSALALFLRARRRMSVSDVAFWKLWNNMCEAL